MATPQRVIDPDRIAQTMRERGVLDHATFTEPKTWKTTAERRAAAQPASV